MAPSRARSERWNPHVAGVRPAAGVGGDHLGRGVRLARLEHHLTRVQQLARLQVAPPVVETLGEHRVVAAPREVHPPHLALPFAEPGLAGEQQRQVLVRGAAAPILGEHRSARPRRAAAPGTLGPNGHRTAGARRRAPAAAASRSAHRASTGAGPMLVSSTRTCSASSSRIVVVSRNPATASSADRHDRPRANRAFVPGTNAQVGRHCGIPSAEAR